MKLRGSGFRLAGTAPPPLVSWPKVVGVNANMAMDRLFDLFPDKYPVMLEETEDYWTFKLDWPRHLLESVDPALPEQARIYYGLELAQLADYMEVRRLGQVDFVFSMFHSRALVAPALAMARHGVQSLRNIVHVDAHHDLAASLWTAGANATLSNSAFDLGCRLDSSESVTQAVDRGFIHKGNFLTAFILGTSQGRLFHSCQGILPGRFWLVPQADLVEVGEKYVTRNILAFQRTLTSNVWELLESAFLPAALSMEETDGTWLDIDLDAFCNRFDGDSDRRDVLASPEEMRLMENSIRTFLADLGKAPWLKHVKAVSVAASPGFFPSEYWDTAIPTVCEGIEKVLSSI